MITPQSILDIIERFVDRWGWEVCYTFGHVVLDDYNLGDSAIDVCLNHETAQTGNLSEMEKATKVFLEWLKTIPEPIRLEAMELAHGD